MNSGKFIFKAIQEGKDLSRRQIFFNPPLVIDYTIHEKIDKETGKENYPEDVPLMGFARFDFGMEVYSPLNVENNWLANGYEGLTSESEPEDILMKTIFFDLFHTFFHIPCDPNYGHYHWALYGNLKDRVII